MTSRTIHEPLIVLTHLFHCHLSLAQLVSLLAVLTSSGGLASIRSRLVRVVFLPPEPIISLRLDSSLVIKENMCISVDRLLVVVDLIIIHFSHNTYLSFT